MRTIIVVLLLSFTFYINTAAQGCSDAGFCTAGSLSVNTHDDTSNAAQTWVSAAFSYGLSDFDVQVISPRLEVRHSFDSVWQASARIGMQITNGDLTSTIGLSDVIVTGGCNLLPELQLTLGAKFPLNNADMRISYPSLPPEGSPLNAPLPMDYQPSLGTIDVIAGVVWHLGDFSLAAAMQQPLTQNSNTFTPDVYPATSAAHQYHPTNGFNRQADVLLRASYMLSTFEEKLRMHLSVLPIYHVANDTYVDSTSVRREIVGSRGVTLNAALLFEYVLSDYNRIELTIAAPVVVRTIRPDGLTRSILIGVEYRTRL